MFVRPPKNMRKDKSIWRLLRAMHGTLVASSCWRRLVRKRLCDSQWKFLTSMPYVGYNETEGPSAMFHEDDFTTEGHDSVLDKLDALLNSDKGRRSTRIDSTAGHESMLLYRTIRWNESGFSYRPDLKQENALTATLILENERPVPTPYTRDAGRSQADMLSELSMSEKACYKSGSSLIQCIALDTVDLLFAARRVRSRVPRADVLALLLLIRVVGYLAGVINYLYQVNPSQIDYYTDAGCAGDVTTRLSTTTGALLHDDHWLERWSVTQKVIFGRRLGAARGLLMKHRCHKAGETARTLVLHCDWVACDGCDRDKKESTTKSDIYRVKRCQHCDEGVTSDRIWKLTKQIGMNLVAGVECLVQQPREKITGTMIPDQAIETMKL